MTVLTDEKTDRLIREFAEQSVLILQDRLIGVYLHGSAVMGCFNPEKSDIEALAKCFNYKANLPQVVIDKIVDSYDSKTNTFKDFKISVGDFTTRYQPVVGAKEINESIEQMTKKSL